MKSQKQFVQKNARQAMSMTTDNLRTMKGHVLSIGQQQDIPEEDLNLMLGRLQYQVKQLESDLKDQANLFEKNVTVTSPKQPLAEVREELKSAQLLRRTSTAETRFSQTASGFRPQTTAFGSRQSTANTTSRHSRSHKNIHTVKRFESAKELMTASSLLLKKISVPNIEQQAQQPDTFAKTTRDHMVSTPTSGIAKIPNDNPYAVENKLVVGRISHSAAVPKQIRKNPFSDLPPISENDLKRGLFQLVNIGLIPKDLDLLPAFNQGTPVLLTAPKIQNDPATKKNRAYLPPDGFLEKFKVDLADQFQNTNIHNNNSTIQPLSLLLNSASNQLFQNNSMDSNFFLTDTNAPVPLNSLYPQPNNNTKKAPTNNQAKLPATTKQHIFSAKKQQEPLQISKNYFITIKNGFIISGAADFKEMKSQFCEQWGSISALLKKLQNIARKYSVNLMHIDGLKLVEIANDLTRVKTEDLIDTLTNKEMVKKVIPTETLASFRGKAWATIKILCSFKMRRAIKDLKQMREHQGETIEKKLKVQFWLKYISSQRKLRKLQDIKFNEYFGIQKNFENNYASITSGKRVEIHINSISLDQFKRNTIEHFLQRENLQLTRLFAIKDSNVEVIMIVPFELPMEVLTYYYKICELGDIQNYKERLHFVCPENISKFPKKFSLAKLLYYSPRALRQIKNIVNYRPAYLVPGMPCKEDSLLGMHLGIPVFSGKFQSVKSLLGKSAAKKLFEDCKLPTAPGAENIRSEEELVNQLTILIAKYANVNKWIIKLDGELRGRGVAFFSLESIRVLSDIRKQRREIDESQVVKIREIVQSLLPSKLQIATPSLYTSYSEFIAVLTAEGGLIEAAPLAPIDQISSPSLLFKLLPNGTTEVLASYDKIQISEYVTFGCLSPQSSLPSLNLKQLSQVIGDQLISLNIYGYITIDMVAFPDITNKLNHPLFWIIGIDCFLNDYSASTFIFQFLARSNVDKVTGKYYLNNNGSNFNEHNDKFLNGDDQQNLSSSSELSNIVSDFEERSFMYIPYIYHLGLGELTYREFFQACRKNGISFDIEKKQGSIFLLVDEIQCGVMSVMTLADSNKKILKHMTDSLNFILQVAGAVQRKAHSKEFTKRSDQLYLMDLISKVRTLNKAADTPQIYSGQQGSNSPPSGNNRIEDKTL